MAGYSNTGSKTSAKMTGKTKVSSTKSAGPSGFAAGGKGANHKMFGKQHADQDKPGETSGTKGKSHGKFIGGGKTKMFGKQHAGSQTPERTGGDKYSPGDKTPPMGKGMMVGKSKGKNRGDD